MARSKAYRRTVAFYRWVETSQPKAAGWIRFPTAGVIGIIVLFWLFIGSASSSAPLLCPTESDACLPH